MGLRERKKEQTRQLIADAAWRLFAAGGFDQVSVAAVAREADVSTATVFNYFPTKEDLFVSGLDVFGDRMVAAVSARPAGQTVLVAVREFLTAPADLLEAVSRGEREALDQARTVHRVVAASAALQAREQQAYARLAAALAERLVDAPGADEIEVQVATVALIGVHRSLVDLVRRRILADDRLHDLAVDVRAAAERGFALLARGLADQLPAPRR